MKSFLILALLLISSIANADVTITFSLTGAGAANTSRSIIVNDADGIRILAWAKDVYGPAIVPPVETNPLICNVSSPPAQCLSTSRVLTNKEGIEAVFDGLFLGLRNNVKNHEGSKASKTANDAIIIISPK